MRALRGELPRLRERVSVVSLQVFGSYVGGESRPGSAIEVLVRFDEPPGRLRFIGLE